MRGAFHLILFGVTGAGDVLKFLVRVKDFHDGMAVVTVPVELDRRREFAVLNGCHMTLSA